MARDSINLIPYGDDPLALLAQHLIEDFSEQLPDLTPDSTGAVVLIPEAHAAQRLRRHLLQQAEQSGQQAILCPQILSLRDWAAIQFNKQHKEPHKICGQHQRELILFDALSKHHSILGSGSPWHLTNDLLKLFDQLTSNQKTLPTSYAEFEEEIAQAYGISANDFPALSHETRLVYTLWNAWHTQLNAEDVYDSEAAYLLGLNADLKNNSHNLYIAGYHKFSVAEQNWLKQLVDKQRCQLYLHGQQRENNEPELELTGYHPDTLLTSLLNAFNKETNNKITNNYSRFLNTCYQHEHHPFLDRAESLVSIPAEDIKKQLKLLFCSAHEEQAHAVELQVRRWLLEGKNNIGIVTENRRLARRVRALLERAEVPLLDLAGWALSTTRAGAVLERWLECIEEDFSHLALLDLLKSPFIFSELDPQLVKHATYRLEHDIIRHENIARNLHRYKKSISLRANKLQWSSEISELLITILDTFESANKILKPLLKGTHNATDYIEALSSSLEVLGMSELFKADAAGERVMEMLDTLKHSATQYPLTFSWADFRTWLGRSLEQFVFTPEKSSSPVVLMGLAQSRLQKFDALIIASAEHEHLPGKTNITPFFNNAVRRQLNLATTHEVLSERFHHFRRLLESAPEILITANNEENGEDVPISPWLEIIHRFYQQAYSSSLQDSELKALVNHTSSWVIRSSDDSLPAKTTQATTTLPKNLIPKSYSPSSYQKLMDCPYQFFAAHGLNLAVSEEVQEALSKSDYGERVHKCLEAFHQDVEQLPGPFKERLTDTNRAAAIKMLEDISQHVFSRDLDESFEHSGWLTQWLKLIPGYIDWQVTNAAQWQFEKAELKSKVAWRDDIELGGRLDRLDQNESGLSVIDYKTGIPPRQSDIEQGEAVQLPFYALLAETELKKPVNRVSYLVLNKGVKYGAQLSDDALDTISQQIGDRLATIIKDMEAEKMLTAWGDEKACSYCNISRLCRLQAWKN